MLTQEELNTLQFERRYFIENGREASLMEWLTSKGTNFTCYIEYKNSLDNETILNNKIEKIRTIIYALHKPLQFTFFYWTLLIFVLHRFNFRKPVMKIILAHFILRCLGDVLDKLGDLMPRYYANEPILDEHQQVIGYRCTHHVGNPERHPLRWFLTRQIGCTLWCLGEMVADWYPLLRTKAFAWDKKSLRLVYCACAIFNLCKASLFIYHYRLSPGELYDRHGAYDQNKVDYFYFPYWIIQLAIIYSSVIYDFSVYHALKKNLSEINYSLSKNGFIQNFKTLSQYRILISAVICVVFLPIISVTLICKMYFFTMYSYHRLEFSFDEIRLSINNVQYFMIFIDQILLLNKKHQFPTMEISFSTNRPLYFNNNNNNSSNNNSSINNNNNSNKLCYSNNSSSIISNHFDNGKPYPITFSNSLTQNSNSLSRYRPRNLSNDSQRSNNMNNGIDPNFYKDILKFDIYSNFSRNNNSNHSRNNRNSIFNAYNYDDESDHYYLNTEFPKKNLSNASPRTIANYDNYFGIKSEWNYLNK